MPADRFKGRRKRTFELFQTRDAQGKVLNCLREVVPKRRKPQPTFYIPGVDENGVMVLGYAKVDDGLDEKIEKKWGGGDEVVIFGGPNGRSPGGASVTSDAQWRESTDEDTSDELDKREGGQDIYQWFGEAPTRKGPSGTGAKLSKGSNPIRDDSALATDELKGFLGEDEYIEDIEELEEEEEEELEDVEDTEDVEELGETRHSQNPKKVKKVKSHTYRPVGAVSGSRSPSVVQQDLEEDELWAIDEELGKILDEETDSVSDGPGRPELALAVDLARPQDTDGANEDYVRGELPEDTVKVVPASAGVKRTLLDFLYGADARLGEDDIAGLDYVEGSEGGEQGEERDTASSPEGNITGATIPVLPSSSIASVASPASAASVTSGASGDPGDLGARQRVFDDPEMQECLDFFDDAPVKATGPRESRPPDSSGPGDAQDDLLNVSNLEEIPGGLFPMDDLSPDELAAMESRIEELHALAAAKQNRVLRRKNAGDLDSLPPPDEDTARRRLVAALQSLQQEGERDDDQDEVPARRRQGPTIADVEASVLQKAQRDALPCVQIVVSRTGVPLNVYRGSGPRTDASGSADGKPDVVSTVLADTETPGVSYTLPSERPASETSEERRQRKRLIRETKRERREAKKEFRTYFDRERQSLEAARLRERGNLQGMVVN